MASADYDKVSDAIGDTTTSPSWALQGTYSTDPSGAAPRKFLAYVLGDGHTGAPPAVEVALAYQYAGYHTETKPAKNWRCFQIDKFVGTPGNKLTKIPFVPPAGFTPPPPLTAPQLARQNCVVKGIMGPMVVRSANYHG